LGGEKPICTAIYAGLANADSSDSYLAKSIDICHDQPACSLRCFQTPGKGEFPTSGEAKFLKNVSFKIPETSPKPGSQHQEVVASSSKRDLERAVFSFFKSPQAYHPSSIKHRKAFDLFSGTRAVGRHLTNWVLKLPLWIGIRILTHIFV
jgi:hypothetical protein